MASETDHGDVMSNVFCNLSAYEAHERVIVRKMAMDFWGLKPAPWWRRLLGQRFVSDPKWSPKMVRICPEPTNHPNVKDQTE